MVFHQLEDLGWVDFDCVSSTVCLVLLGLMGIWKNRLSSGSEWNIQNKVNPTQVRELMDQPVFPELGMGIMTPR